MDDEGLFLSFLPADLTSKSRCAQSQPGVFLTTSPDHKQHNDSHTPRQRPFWGLFVQAPVMAFLTLLEKASTDTNQCLFPSFTSQNNNPLPLKEPIPGKKRTRKCILEIAFQLEFTNLKKYFIWNGLNSKLTTYEILNIGVSGHCLPLRVLVVVMSVVSECPGGGANCVYSLQEEVWRCSCLEAACQLMQLSLLPWLAQVDGRNWHQLIASGS